MWGATHHHTTPHHEGDHTPPQHKTPNNTTHRTPTRHALPCPGPHTNATHPTMRGATDHHTTQRNATQDNIPQCSTTQHNTPQPQHEGVHTPAPHAPAGRGHAPLRQAAEARERHTTTPSPTKRGAKHNHGMPHHAGGPQSTTPRPTMRGPTHHYTTPQHEGGHTPPQHARPWGGAYTTRTTATDRPWPHTPASRTNRPPGSAHDARQHASHDKT